MTAPDPMDPLVCINTRMAGGPPTCTEPEGAHCDGCRFCPGSCTCLRATPLDKYWLDAALDAFARRGGAANWQALGDVISHSCAESYRSDITAAIAPLLDEIRRLATEVNNLKHSQAAD